MWNLHSLNVDEIGNFQLNVTRGALTVFFIISEFFTGGNIVLVEGNQRRYISHLVMISLTTFLDRTGFH